MWPCKAGESERTSLQRMRGQSLSLSISRNGPYDRRFQVEAPFESWANSTRFAPLAAQGILWPSDVEAESIPPQRNGIHQRTRSKLHPGGLQPRATDRVTTVVI